MPNGTSAAPIAGGDPAPAMANTDIAMQTRTDRTKSLIPGFAQVLESSFETTGRTGDSRISKLSVSAKSRDDASPDHASSGVNWTLAESQRPIDSAQPEIVYGFSPSAGTTPVSVNSDSSAPQNGIANPKSSTTLSDSARGNFENQVPELRSSEQIAPSLSAGTGTTITTFTSLSSIQQQNVSSDPDGAAPIIALNQTAQSSPSSPLAEPDASPAPANPNQPVATEAVPATRAPFVTPSFSQQAPPIPQTWTGQGTPGSATTVSVPEPESPDGAAAQTILPALDESISPLQTAQSIIAASAADPSARQQKLSPENSVGKAKTDASAAARMPPPGQFATSNEIAAGTPKIQSVAPPTPVASSLPPDPASSVPPTWENTAIPAPTDPASPNLGNDDSATPIPADKTASESSAAFSQPENAGTDDNSGPTNIQSSAPAAIPELSMPAPAASDVSALTQTVSLTAALRLEPSGPATSSTSINLGDTAGDAQLPSAVVVHRAAEAAELSAGLQAWNGGDNAQTRLVQSARLGGNLGTSEMNIALRADALGAVELHAHVTGDLVGAAISVERHDAHALISSDLGTLHQALNDRQLRVGDVKVFHGAVGSDAAAADGQSSQRRETVPQRAQATNWTSGHSPASVDATASMDTQNSSMFFDSNGRLSVRA